jgi:hypothetical protein
MPYSREVAKEITNSLLAIGPATPAHCVIVEAAPTAIDAIYMSMCSLSLKEQHSFAKSGKTSETLILKKGENLLHVRGTCESPLSDPHQSLS